MRFPRPGGGVCVRVKSARGAGGTAFSYRVGSPGGSASGPWSASAAPIASGLTLPVKDHGSFFNMEYPNAIRIKIDHDKPNFRDHHASAVKPAEGR